MVQILNAKQKVGLSKSGWRSD